MRKSTRTLQLALIGAILLFFVLLLTRVFTLAGAGWWEGLLIGVIVGLGILVGYRQLAIRSERVGSLKRVRDSILKWRWEDSQRREW